jgi:hypothetical protein
MLPEVKEYISEAIYDPEIWDTPGFALVVFMAITKMAPKMSKARN